MIQFVFVGNKEELTENYLTNTLNQLTENEEVFKNIEPYDNQDKKIKFKINTLQNKLYFVDTEFLTHNGSLQLFFNIYPQEKCNEYDNDLNDLKFSIKKAFRRDWYECFWLQDQQSNQFAQDLYLEIHLTENKLREFINIVMTRNYGTDWWSNYTTKKIREKYMSRRTQNKRIAQGFKDVNDNLLSIDTDDLLGIMCKQTYKFEPPSNHNVTILLENLVEVGDLSKVAVEHTKLIQKLREFCKVETDLWKELFGKFFSDDFKDDMNDFSKNRNHIAHNKLIDYNAYQTIFKNIEKVKTAIKKAKDEYESYHISDEKQEELRELEELAKLEEQELYYYSENERIEDETGVNIRNTEEILNLMEERIISELENIKEEFYFRNDLEFEIFELSEGEATTLFKVLNKVTEEEIEIKAFTLINDDRGAESNIVLRVYNKNEILNGELRYINGDGQIVENESYYLPTIEDTIYFVGHEDFIMQIVNKIEELFPNLVEVLKVSNNRSIQECGESIICESVCEECGEETVCLDGSIAPYGKCVNCGCENELSECLRCNNVYNSNFDGDSEFCESCCTYIENHS